jgi:hypothetical protein
MKNKIFGFLFVVSLFLIVGIIGGVDNGEPLSNMLWCIPLTIIMIFSGIAINL